MKKFFTYLHKKYKKFHLAAYVSIVSRGLLESRIN